MRPLAERVGGRRGGRKCQRVGNAFQAERMCRGNPNPLHPPERHSLFSILAALLGQLSFCRRKVRVFVFAWM